VQPGDAGVKVGIIDTGIDGSHPDIAPNFDGDLSRNFTTDIPAIDGPCEDEADHSCTDANDVDEDGHGTHVAGTIASPLNGTGIAGVAPKASIVNLRAGQDSGYFFAQATVDALTYAADNGIDVVNMSFYIDPWLYNCRSNAADSPAAQAQQQTTIVAVQRAVDYARRKGVLPVAALGNENTDIDDPKVDATSPDYPPDAAYSRTIDNGCLSVPTETDGVVGVSSTGRSGRKAFYSNWSLDQTQVAAPGGDTRDFTVATPMAAFSSTT
jgi:subtilisin family serine protease